MKKKLKGFKNDLNFKKMVGRIKMIDGLFYVFQIIPPLVIGFETW